MDSQTKFAIKSLVLDLRHTLEDELTIVVKRYGLAGERRLPTYAAGRAFVLARQLASHPVVRYNLLK